jgi:hypothetical protein
VIEKTWKVTLLIDTPFKGISTWKVTYLDKLSMTFVASMMVVAQGRTHKNWGSLLQLTFMYKKVIYLSGGVFACDKQDWAEEDLLLLPFFPIYFGHLGMEFVEGYD